MNPPEVCIINPTRMKKLGVIPGVIVDEARQFARRCNANFSIVMFHELGNRKIYYKSMEENRIRLFSIPISSSRGLLRLVLSYPRSLVWTYILCRGILSKSRIVLIRSDDTILTGLPGRLLSFMLRKPFVILIAGTNREIISFRLSSVRLPSLLKRIFLKFTSIVERVVISKAMLLVVSRELAHYYSSIGGRHIVITPTFLDLSLFSPRASSLRKPSSTTNLLFVGRLEREKGITILIHAFMSLLERHRGLKLTVVGDGTLKGKLLELVKERHLEDSVHFLGTLNHKELSFIYQKADVFVLPSYSEGLPVAMLEAMASKLPVIVSPVGSISHVIEHLKNGILVKPGSIASIVSAVSNLIEHKELRIRIAENGYDYVKRFLGSYVGLHLRIYSRIIGQSLNNN